MVEGAVIQDAESQDNIVSLLNPQRVRIAKRLAQASSWIVILIGLLVFVGWRFDISVLTSVKPGWEPMVPNVAATCILSGLAILFQFPSSASTRRKRIGKSLGGLVGLLGLLTLFEYLTSLDFRIDYLLFAGNSDLARTSFYGRMSPLSSIILLLTGFALVNLDWKGETKHPISHLIAFVIAFLALIPLIGYLFGTPFNVGVGTYSDMAGHAALSFLLISFSVFFCRIDHDLPAVILSDGPGGFAARRVVIPAVLILLFFGWFRVVAERHHFLSSSFGTATFTALTIAVIVLLIWQQSVDLQKGELVRRRAQLERDQLQIDTDLRNQFVSMLSHDLRTPLTVANARAQLIIKRGKTIEDCRSNAEVLVSSLNRMDGMIQDLLDSSLVRSGRPIPLAMKECDVSEVVSSVLRDLVFIYGDRFVEKNEAQALTVCDPGAIRRVLENLCNNAVKYGASGSSIVVSVSAHDAWVHLSVHNSGEPISPEDQKDLFEPFERTRRGEKSGKKGWGIGLALVRVIAETHGGRVWVQSGRDIGTTFFVEIPKRDA